jgi:SAM-dependent methyltransferase
LDPEFSQSYRELYENHWWFRIREQLIVEILRRRQPPGGWKTILDVGCGDGLLFRQLKQFGEVEGIEPLAEVVSPDNPFRQNIHIGSFDKSFQPGKQYSLILMLDVLEHMEEPVEALRHAISLLQPGGSLLITVPAFRMLWTSHDRLNDHFTRYTKASFEQVAEKAAIKVVEARYLFFWLFFAKLAVRAKERLAGSQPTIPKVPPPALNRVLYWVSRLEEKILGKLPVPMGSSLLIIGEAAASADSSTPSGEGWTGSMTSDKFQTTQP